ncbi:MAG: diaminopimelate decarboxylase [Ottowia sp.]|nr:diaminopimelate decarboxylase [Ottowia sp.]
MHNIQFKKIPDIALRYGSPVWLYDAAVIRERIAQLHAFDVIRYAQKACSNLSILALMRASNVMVDAVSLGEIERALQVGYQTQEEPSGVIFTADVFDRPTLARVVAENIPVNVGSIDMLAQLGACAPGHRVWLRINPGFGHGHSNKTNTGGENSKHGIWHTHLSAAMQLIKKYQLYLVGLHMHIGSGVDYAHLERVCSAMVSLVGELNYPIESISAGGGLSVPYKAGEAPVDTGHYFNLWDQARKQIERQLSCKIRLEIEPGRFLIAEAGKLVAEVRAVKEMGDNYFVLVDTGFNDLMRPAMYGSYHEISVISKEGVLSDAVMRPTIVGGPLCESGDVFTQSEGGAVVPRMLPTAKVGDYLIFHHTGAYGASMSSNYNSRPLLPEVLIDGVEERLIRRRQTIGELLALEIFP